MGRARSLHDPQALAELAMHDPHEQVRLTAVQRIHQQPLLTELAKTATDPEVRCEAVARLTDQAVLGQIVRSDPEPTVKYCAAKRLNDKSLGLYYADVNYYDEIVRWTLYRVKDPEVLAKVAELTSNNTLRNLAKRKLAKLEGK